MSDQEREGLNQFIDDSYNATSFEDDITLLLKAKYKIDEKIREVIKV